MHWLRQLRTGLRDVGIDVRYAARTLLNASTITTVATLGLGIGVVTGFFAIVDAVLFAPIPAHGDVVVRIWKQDAEDYSLQRFPLSYPELKMWRDETRTFRSLAAISYADVSTAAVVVNDEAVPVTVSPVSADFFDVLHGGAPLLGRWFNASEEGNVTEIATVVSEAFWRRVSGGDRNFVGRRLRWPGGSRTLVVVGVAPATLRYPANTDLWVPIDAYVTSTSTIASLNVRSRRFANFHFLGRLAPGVTVDQARAELDVISRNVAARFPDDYRPLPVVAEPLVNASLGTLRLLTLFLFGGAALVFFAAGGNVAALLLMRASTQSRDVALRLALGAGPFRIARQILVESTLLGAVGALVGLLLAHLCLVMAKAVTGTDIPRLASAAISPRVLVFCVLVTFVWVAIFGTTPLWRLRRFDTGRLTQHLAIRSTRSAAALRGMIVGQVTVAVVIATAAGLLVQSFLHLHAVDRGFDAGNMAVVQLILPDAHYPTPAAREQFYSRLVRNLAAMPGVAGATTVHLVPGTGQAGLSARMLFEGQPPDRARTNPYGTWEPVVPSYFATLGIPLTQGRAFSDADDRDAPPVAIVSEAVADRYWPGQNPIGKRLQFTSQFSWVTVVGVAADTRYRELTRDWLTVYFPAKQFFFFSPGAVIVRTTADPSPLLPDIRRTIRLEEPAAAVHSIETMETLVAQETARPRTAVAVATLFAVIAVFMAAVGVYGVFSYDFTHRAREFAVHSAVGASPGHILGMTLRQSVVVGALGAAIGLGAAALLMRYLTAVLFEVKPLDAPTFAVAGFGLLAIVVLAALRPARRAARVDPVSLLRAE